MELDYLQAQSMLWQETMIQMEIENKQSEYCVKHCPYISCVYHGLALHIK